MNKKEVLEIRKQFTPENCAITRICGCYVDHEKEKKTELKKAFLSMPEKSDEHGISDRAGDAGWNAGISLKAP